MGKGGGHWGKSCGTLGNHIISDSVSCNEIPTPQGCWEDWK